MTAIGRVLVTSLCALVAACASTGPQADESREQPPTRVQVNNQAFLDMTIYILRGSERIRLGTATGLSRTTFTIPARVMFGATTLRFLADPIGSARTPVSEEITVREGDELELTIPPA